MAVDPGTRSSPLSGVPANTGVPASTGAPASTARRWHRPGWFLAVWHLLFLLLAVIGVARVFIAGQPVAHAWTATGLAAAAAAWYAAPAFVPRAFRRTAWERVWLAGVVVLAAALTILAPDFAWLAFPIAFQIGYRLPVVVAAPAAAGVAVAAIVGLAGHGGAIRVAEVAGPLLGVAMAVVVAVGYRMVLAERDRIQRLARELSAAHEQLAAAQRAAGAAEERARLSREIHDTLAQGMASTVLLLQVAEQEVEPNPRARATLVQAQQTLRQNLEEARRFVRELAPPGLTGRPLDDSVRRLCTQWSADAGLPVQFMVTGEPRPLPVDHEIALYRAAQETLSNVRKHASAREVKVTLSYLGGDVVLDVVDDGRGFDAAVSPPGHGLRGMRERLELVGGRLEVEAAPATGTAVAAIVTSDPVPVDHHDE